MNNQYAAICLAASGKRCFSLVYDNGMLPRALCLETRDSLDLKRPKTPLLCSYESLWKELVTDYFDSANGLEFLKIAFGFGKENLAWRQRERIAPEGGFCYLDMLFSGP